MPTASDHRALILELHDKGAFRLCEKGDEIKLKSGILSPIYVDLRITVSHPELLQQIAQCLSAATDNVPHDLLCGVPYTALPFATAMSISRGVPMVMRRKERKEHGTGKLIEGIFNKGATCLVVEDLVTSGGSVLETVDDLIADEIKVHDVVVLLDREQGARAKLAHRGIQLHAVATLSEMLSILQDERRISVADADRVRQFVRDHQIPIMTTSATPRKVSRSYKARSGDAGSAIGRKLLSLISEKRSNLAVAADVTTKDELLQLAENIGSEICVFKTHADIVRDWDKSTGIKLREIANRLNFLIFEDRKFADIGNTVVSQMHGGVHEIATWADFVNAHAVPGPGVVTGIRKACEELDRPIGLLLLAEMSSTGNLATALPGYTDKVVEMARKNADFVFGFISMGKLQKSDDAYVYMTPGVKLDVGGDGLGQQYKTPAEVIGEKGSDVIIVGRGIYAAADPRSAAAEYRQAAWDAYINRIGPEPDDAE